MGHALVAAVKSGTMSINAAAAVATLPEQEQVAAAKGGRATMKRAKPEASEEDRQGSVPALKARISAREAANAQLYEQR